MTNQELTALVNSVASHNLASLVDVRRKMSERGVSDRYTQDVTIMRAINALHLTPSCLEGRHGISAAENEACYVFTHFDGSKERWGYLSLRNAY